MKQESKNVLQIKAFNEAIKLEGKTYYDSHSRIYCILRLPAIMKHLFPQICKRKVRYEILCFPSRNKLMEHLDTTKDVPLILNLFESENENKMD